MKLYVNIEIGNVRKIYTFPSAALEWTKRDLVADFVATPAGLAAYAAFKEGIARSKTASLYDYQTGRCLAGTVGELDA